MEDLEEIHNLLLEANLPSSVCDLKNPTEKYVVNLINIFLRRFHIDVDTIRKPTKTQQDTIQMSYSDNADIIGLINLHVAMGQICDRIYLKDFCITDIISPGSKRIRRQGKFLANFILYATNKELEIGDKVSDIKNRAYALQEMLNKNDEVNKAIKDKQLHITKQLQLREKIMLEIQAVQSKISGNNEKYIKLTAEMTTAEEKKQQAINVFESYKTQASNLNKVIAKLESEVVKSPETYEKRLKELENQQSAKIEHREALLEAFQDKKNLIEQRKKTLSFIQMQLENLSEVRCTKQKLKTVNAQGDSVQKQVEALETQIEDLKKKKLETQKDTEHETNEVNDLRTQCDQRLAPLRNLKAQLLSDRKTHQQTLETEQVRYNDICQKLKERQSEIKKLEGETLALFKCYQEIYDSEISQLPE
ncbi:uncharacterized protein LOC143212102 [Lasioglossum baleicum]|uniref:uncharacterized protein LOC143212102 n=1 Tax=Lasioglossum baleicum TaxID=434251 RepID=UPI003FCDFB69